MCFFTICRLMCGRVFVTTIFTICASSLLILVNMLRFYKRIADCSDSIQMFTSRHYGPYKLYECHANTIIDNALVSIDTDSHTNDAYMVFTFWVTTGVVWCTTALLLLCSMYCTTLVMTILTYTPWIVVTVIHVTANFLFLMILINRYYRYSMMLDTKFFLFFYEAENHYRVESMVNEHRKTLQDISNEKMSHLFQINMINIVALILLVFIVIQLVDNITNILNRKK